jgi:hypothetical protein
MAAGQIIEQRMARLKREISRAVPATAEAT